MECGHRAKHSIHMKTGPDFDRDLKTVEATKQTKLFSTPAFEDNWALSYPVNKSA